MKRLDYYGHSLHTFSGLLKLSEHHNLFQVRMDSDIKKHTEAMYGELGIDLTARYQCISSTDTSG